MNENCENCKYWIKLNKKKGECRRNPPTTAMDGFKNTIGKFPTSEIEWWCGEWKNKDE